MFFHQRNIQMWLCFVFQFRELSLLEKFPRGKKKLKLEVYTMYAYLSHHFELVKVNTPQLKGYQGTLNARKDKTLPGDLQQKVISHLLLREPFTQIVINTQHKLEKKRV